MIFKRLFVAALFGAILSAVACVPSRAGTAVAAADCSAYANELAASKVGADDKKTLMADCTARLAEHATLTSLERAAKFHVDATMAASNAHFQTFVAADDATDTTAGFTGESVIESGTLSNGVKVVVVPLDGGGSARVLSSLLFVVTSGGVSYVGELPAPAGQGHAFVLNGALIAQYAKYRNDEPTCCPGHFQIYHYSIENGRLKTLASVLAKDAVKDPSPKLAAALHAGAF